MPSSEVKEAKSEDSQFINVLITTFTTIFLAELGDKTQIATLMFSAQSGKPIVVFIGASIALILSSLIGVLLGRWISTNLPEKSFKMFAGIIMVSIGILYGLQGLQGLAVYINMT